MSNRANLPRSYYNYLQTMKDGRAAPIQQDIEEIIQRFQGSRSIHSRIAPVTYLVDYSTGKYLYVAEGCFDMFGYTAMQWIEEGLQGFLQKWHPDDLEIMNKYIFPENLQFLEHTPRERYEDIIFSYNYRVRNIVGDYITILQRSSYIPGPSPGKPLGTIGVAFDITHFKTNTSIVHTIEEVRDVDGRYYNHLLYKRTYDTDVLNPLLSSREIEIVQHLARGLSSKQIAHALGLSIHTVNNHRKNMLNKTGCKSTGQLVDHSRSRGLI